MARKEHQTSRLINHSQEEYGPQFKDHLLEQYKLFVESAQRVSEKRITTSNYLLTVCSTLLTLFGIASGLHIGGLWLLIIPMAGLLVSFTWYSLVVSYKNLNTAKFEVIHELENHLPAGLFRHEWYCCDHGRGKAYRPITHWERWIPVIFAAVYVSVAIWTVVESIAERKAPPPTPSAVQKNTPPVPGSTSPK